MPMLKIKDVEEEMAMISATTLINTPISEMLTINSEIEAVQQEEMEEIVADASICAVEAEAEVLNDPIQKLNQRILLLLVDLHRGLLRLLLIYCCNKTEERSEERRVGKECRSR